MCLYWEDGAPEGEELWLGAPEQAAEYGWRLFGGGDNERLVAPYSSSDRFTLTNALFSDKVKFRQFIIYGSYPGSWIAQTREGSKALDNAQTYSLALAGVGAAGAAGLAGAGYFGASALVTNSIGGAATASTADIFSQAFQSNGFQKELNLAAVRNAAVIGTFTGGFGTAFTYARETSVMLYGARSSAAVAAGYVELGAQVGLGAWGAALEGDSVAGGAVSGGLQFGMPGGAGAAVGIGIGAAFDVSGAP
jgi:hypothetical protein